MKTYKLEIPFKMPSCNEYINACRYNRYKGAKMKRDIQDKIAYYLRKLPKFNRPVKIHFHWFEGNKKRDLDRYMFCKEIYFRYISEFRKVRR